MCSHTMLKLLLSDLCVYTTHLNDLQPVADTLGDSADHTCLYAIQIVLNGVHVPAGQ